MLINPDHRHVVEVAGLVDQESPAFSQDSIIGGVPRDSQCGRDTGHRQMVDHQRFQRPAQRSA